MNFRNISCVLKDLKKDKCLSKISKVLQSFLNRIPEYLNDGPMKLKISTEPGEEEEVLQELMRCIAFAGIVRDFPVDVNRSYEESDFYQLSDTATLCFCCLNALCQQGLMDQCPLPDADTLSTLLLLCGAHHQTFLWTSNDTIAGSKELLNNLCLIFQASTSRDLIILKDRKGRTVTDRLIAHFKVTLTKENWRRNPCTSQVYKWVLLHLKIFELEDLLSAVLPAALLFVDDHMADNNYLGIQCLHHIILNVPPTVLSWQGRSEVVYDALHHLVYKKEPEIISILHPCFLDLLAGMELDPNSEHRPINKLSKYDILLTNVLSNMEMEQKIKLRKVYSQQLPLYIDRMGITVLSHGKHLFSVVHEYLSIYDGPNEESRLNVLKSLQLIIRVAWPRMSDHCGGILKSLVRLLYDFLMNPPNVSESVKREVITQATECLSLLNKSCPETFQNLISELITIQDLAQPVLEILRSVCKCEEDKT